MSTSYWPGHHEGWAQGTMASCSVWLSHWWPPEQRESRCSAPQTVLGRDRNWCPAQDKASHVDGYALRIPLTDCTSWLAFVLVAYSRGGNDGDKAVTSLTGWQQSIYQAETPDRCICCRPLVQVVSIKALCRVLWFSYLLPLHMLLISLVTLDLHSLHICKCTW